MLGKKKGKPKGINPWALTGYKAGQNVAAKIMKPEPGGYAVLIPKDNLPGFLPTEDKYSTGEEVLCQFVCVHNNRVLLSTRFSATSPTGSQEKVTQKIDWRAELEGRAPEEGALAASQAEQAFNVYAQTAQPQKPRLRRATDLIMPPCDGSEANQFKIADYDLEWLITDLEGGMRTGCVKACSEEKLSRSAMLLYRGRVVGCIYGCKNMPGDFATEDALHHMLADLALPETQVTIYDLPEDATLSMSSLFLGHPVDRTDDLDARSYMDYLAGWFQQKKQTACMAISLPSTGGNCLVFVHEGNFGGSFHVDEQKFSRNIADVHQILANDPNAGLAASILPPEVTSAAMKFGYSLSMARKRGEQPG